jgi:3-(3-hydroxy-phenyl)propionate hydroxylase
VLFAGDAAHQVSPFGARGANSGIQDADNLCWKLKLVIDGKAPSTLLDSFSEERVFAADENILNSTRSTDFITPKSTMSSIFRNAALTLAREHAFARTLVNSGRLSVPTVLTQSRLNTPDTSVFAGDMVPGAPMDDAPMREDETDFWLLERVGNRFMALLSVSDPSELDAATVQASRALGDALIPIEVVLVSRHPGTASSGLRVFVDYKNRFAERFDARPGTIYLMRPDQHVAARWRAFDPSALKTALARATGNLQ